MIECKNVVGYHPNIYLIDEVEATDIDNPIDFDFAEFVYRRKLISAAGGGTASNCFRLSAGQYAGTARKVAA